MIGPTRDGPSTGYRLPRQADSRTAWSAGPAPWDGKAGEPETRFRGCGAGRIGGRASLLLPRSPAMAKSIGAAAGTIFGGAYGAVFGRLNPLDRLRGGHAMRHHRSPPLGLHAALISDQVFISLQTAACRF